MSVDGWYRAEGSQAVFGFCVTHGRVTTVAPYGRRWLLGCTWADAWAKLHAQGYEIVSLRHGRQVHGDQSKPDAAK